MSASFAWRQLQCRRACSPNIVRVGACARRLVERAAGEAERRRADRGAEDVERAPSRCLKPSPRLAEQRGGRHAAVVEAQRRERMRRDHVDALGDRRGRASPASTMKARDALRARRLAGAGEHDVEIGDAAVGDPGLLAVERRSRRRRGARRHRDRGDIRAGARLRQREGGDRLAARDRAAASRAAARRCRTG